MNERLITVYCSKAAKKLNCDNRQSL